MAKVKSAPADPVWTEFRRRHQGHQFLREDPLYALTEDVVTAVADGVPGFFTAIDEAFERDLARTSGAGFFRRRPINPGVARAATAPTPEGYTRILPIPVAAARLAELPTTGDLELDLERYLLHCDYLARPKPLDHERVCPPLRGNWEPETVDAQPLRLLCELGAAGRSAAEADHLRKQVENETDVTRRKQEAYSMWLTLNPAFQDGVRDLRCRWETQIREQGRFPVHPCLDAFGGPGTDGRLAKRCRDEFVLLYRLWGVERLLTWELPLPLNPKLDGLDAARMLARDELPPPGGQPPKRGDPPWPYTAEDGVSVFLPWHLMRGRQYSLEAVLDRVRLEHVPSHLAGWLTKPTDGDGGPNGDIALQQTFWLYRCFVLVLGRRYAEKCSGNVGRLDIVLGDVIGRTDEQVRKLRQSLARDLKNAAGD